MFNSPQLRGVEKNLARLGVAMRQPLSGLSRKWWYFICGLVFLFALVLRIANSQAGLPYIGDDTDTYSFALYMNRRTSLDPQMFIYPSLVFMYGYFMNQIAVQLANLRGGDLRSDSLNWGLEGWGWTLSNPDVLLLNRIGMGLVGAVLCVVAIAIGVEVAGRLSGLVAGLALAVNPFMIDQETRFTVNGFAAFFCAVATYFALLYVSRLNPKWLYLSGMAAGLAAGSKYTAGVVILAPILGALVVKKSKSNIFQIRSLLGTIFFFGLSFVVSTPFSIIKFQDFLGGITGGGGLYFSSNFYGAETSPGIAHLADIIGFLVSFWGVGLLLLGALGVVVLLLINTKAWVITYVPFILFTGFIALSSVNRHGNHLISYPVIAVAVGTGFSFLVGTFIVARQHREARTWPVALPALIALIPIGVAVASGFNQVAHDLKYEDPRVKIIDALNQKDLGTGLVIATELRIHPAERERIRLAKFVEVIPLEQIVACEFPSNSILVLPTSVTTWREAVARRIGESKPPNNLNTALQEALASAAPIERFGTRETVLDYNFEDPEVIAVKASDISCGK